MNTGRLTFFCGKMGAGKSTAARKLAGETKSVLLCEDEWLASLYPHKITSLASYVEYSRLLKPPIATLVQSILVTGTDVVMDFPANTVSQRTWLKSIFSRVKAPHTLIYIDLPDERCLAQIEKRRKQETQRAATDTVEMFEQMKKYFVAPTDEEGFTIAHVIPTHG